MKRIIIPLISFLLLVLQGIALDLLPASLKASDMFIVPHWILIFLILVALFFDSNDSFYAVVYGIIFGLLTDIVYTGVLGVYMFVYPFALYMVHLLKRLLQTNIVMTIVITAICIFTTEVLLFFIYSFVDLTNVTLTTFLKNRFITTLIANLLFLIVIYLISIKLLRWIKTSE